MKEKRIFCVALTLCAGLTLSACVLDESDGVVLPPAAPIGDNFLAGTFSGVGSGGFRGDVAVEVTFDANRIVHIEVTEHNETESFLNRAVDAVIPSIIDAQSTDVDILSGVTMTSEAIINAVNHAIAQAGA
jgi:fumarate reductase flavoprotein subunit